MLVSRRGGARRSKRDGRRRPRRPSVGAAERSLSLLCDAADLKVGSSYLSRLSERSDASESPVSVPVREIGAGRRLMTLLDIVSSSVSVVEDLSPSSDEVSPASSGGLSFLKMNLRALEPSRPTSLKNLVTAELGSFSLPSLRSLPRLSS